MWWLTLAFTTKDTKVHKGKAAIPDDNNSDKSFWLQMAQYSQLAVVLPACTVAGWLIGLALDHYLHTTWLYLLGLIVGIVAGFVELVRTVISKEPKA